MAILDKAKASAERAREQATHGLEVGRARLDEAQLRRWYGRLVESLWVTEPERAAVARVLEGCPGQRLPADSGSPVLAPVNVPDPRPPQAGTSPGSGNEVYFENCDAARAAGAAPVRRGGPWIRVPLGR
jgi:hypothetical protein